MFEVGAIGFDRAGVGSPVVLLHGILGDRRMWRPQRDDLARDHDVIIWDTPGCGRSPDPPSGFRMPDYADSLAGFIEGFGLDRRPHVIGLSWGGALALELERRHPGMATSFILASTYAGWAGSLPAPVVEARLAQAINEARLAPSQFVPGWIPGLLTETAPTALVDEVTSVMLDARAAGYLAMAHAVAEADLRDVLPRISVPSLLLYGELDVRSPVHVGEAMNDAIPGSKLVVLPGVGHLCNMEAPEAFDRAVRSFIDDLESADDRVGPARTA